MRKIQTSSGDKPARLLCRLMVPQLDYLNSSELIDLFVSTAKHFEEQMLAGTDAEQLERIQVQLAVIKDEIYRKSNTSPECGIFSGYFYASLINRN
jgi:hypothetical protein